MSAESEHEPRWHGTGYGGGAIVCRCGDQCEDGYNAHLAERYVSAAATAIETEWATWYSHGHPVDGDAFAAFLAAGQAVRAALRGDA